MIPERDEAGMTDDQGHEAHVLEGRYRLRGPLGIGLFALMLGCCLAIAFAPEGWRLLQWIAALLQMFLTGVAAAQRLPIWESVPRIPGREPPSAQ